MDGQDTLDSLKNPAERPAGRLRQTRMQQILEAAEQEFATNGFEGTTTRDIATRAALPKANVHYYFGTKERIYRKVLDSILVLWMDEADFWISARRPPREAFSGYIAAKIKSARERPLSSRIYARELLRGAPLISAYLNIALRDRVEGLTAVINGWAERGLIKPISPEHLLFCIWAMTQTYADFGVQIGAVLGKKELDDEVYATAVKTITEMVLNTVLPGGAK